MSEYRRRRPRLTSRTRAVSAITALAAIALLGTANGTSIAASAGNSVPNVTGDAKVDRLLSRMTLDEKLTMIEGEAEAASTNQYEAGYLPGVPRLGIPSLRLTDGPPGVATSRPSTGMTGTMGVAATFSAKDARRNGVVIGRDARALGQDIVLEPFVNMDRDTAWSRGYNTFGEDPLLTGTTGAAEIEGIQSQGTMAQVKHYIAYDGGNNVDVDQQTLHEIYLQPFTDAVNAGVSSIMCSYNMVNGSQACDNSDTLTTILRDQLGFKGFVTSDWGANHDTGYINSGLDMEMPGGGISFLTSYFSRSAMTAAINSGEVKVSRIDQAVGRILYEMDRFGLLNGASKHSVTPEPTTADEKIVQQTAQDSAVLLKNNDNALPLSASQLRSTALIGPGAGQLIATGISGEKAAGIYALQQSPLSALEQATGTHVSYAPGDDMTGTPIPASALSHNGQPGLLRTDNTTKATQVDAQVNSTSSNHRALPAGGSYTWTGTLTVPAAGSYWLNLQVLGAGGSLLVDGNPVGSTGFLGSTAPRYGTTKPGDNGVVPSTDGLDDIRAQVNLTQGSHTIEVDANADVSNDPMQVRVNWVTPVQQQANFDAAIDAAKHAKTAVVFAWSTGDLSTPLPEGQDQLIEAVAKANPNTIVVLNNGEPVAVPWLSDVKAVLDMWYPGDKGGPATANVLLGKADPAGRLPFTWPAGTGQAVATDPSHLERSSNGVKADGTACTAAEASGFTTGGFYVNPACKTTYSEGIFIGYRYYDQQHETPLFPFGYGLSYTRFSYSGLHVKAGANGLDVSFRITNTGDVAGDEVPQVYLGAPDQRPAGVQFAASALAAYDRVSLRAGQSAYVTLHVPLRQLQYWSTAANGWRTAVGTRSVSVGTSEHDIQVGTSTFVR